MKSRPWLFALIIAWLIFVVALAIWWMIFSVQLINRLNALVGDEQFNRHQQMLLMEGSVLVILLLIGGSGLIYYYRREQKRFDDISHFFSSFSHDIKTSITRLVLQGESMTSQDHSARKFDQFQKNLLALELQLENSMHVAQYESRGITLEDVDLKQIVGRIHTAWPEVKIQLKGETRLRTDAPAIESILKNLLSNSVMHGSADEARIQVIKEKSFAKLIYSDNGKVQLEDLDRLGHEIQPSQKGSGIGLYLVRNWAEKLGGKIHFAKSEENSLLVTLTLPDAAAKEVI